MVVPAQIKWYTFIFTYFILFWLYCFNSHETLFAGEIFFAVKVLIAAAVLSPVILTFLAPSLQDEIVKVFRNRNGLERFLLIAYFYVARFFPLLLGLSMVLFTSTLFTTAEQKEVRTTSGIVHSVEFQRYRSHHAVKTNIYIWMQGDAHRYDLVSDLLTNEKRTRLLNEVSGGDSLYMMFDASVESPVPTGRRTIIALRSSVYGDYLVYENRTDRRSKSAVYMTVIFFIFASMGFVFATDGGRFWETLHAFRARKQRDAKARHTESL